MVLLGCFWSRQKAKKMEDEAGTRNTGATTMADEAGNRSAGADEAEATGAGATTMADEAGNRSAGADEAEATGAGATVMADEAGTTSGEVDEAGATMTADEAGVTSMTATSTRDFEVFLNFRGPDCRSTVVDVIHKALDQAGVSVFYDDESIRAGEVIGKELMEAITNSKIYIPIFSKDYASSKWCLLELEKIMECWEASQQQVEKKTVIPVFFGVHVSTDVKLKSEVYTNALQNHKSKHGEDAVKRWENALRKAAEIKGLDISKLRLVALSQRIVQEVCCKLWRRDPGKVPDGYVGIDKPMEDIMELLNLAAASDVRIVAIHGIGGVGKSTLARLIFHKISSDNFQQGIALLSDVHEKSSKPDGIVDLQKELLWQLLRVTLKFRDAEEGVKMIKDRLERKKVLIVLDNLEKSDQLLKLAGESSWFGRGSRIIITTRDIGIIPNDEGFYRYKLQEMGPDDALKLFSKLVFKSDLPPQRYNKLSREVVDTIGGLPLAIVNIAHSFRGDITEIGGEAALSSRLEKLKTVVDMDIRKRLMLGYEELGYHEKEIFLDIACLFINEEIEDATYYWKAQKLDPISVIKVLRNMSLVEIVDGNKLWMHNLLRNLGRNLVDEENNYFGKRTRLWSPDVAFDVVRRKKGTEKVLALKLGELHEGCTFNHEQFAEFKNLKFLELKGGNFTNEDFKKVFSELRWLSWNNCAHEFPATNLCFENLFVLMISSENLITDKWGGWNEIKAATNLKVLKSAYCQCLMKSPNFSAFPNLERLVLKDSYPKRERVSPIDERLNSSNGEMRSDGYDTYPPGEEVPQALFNSIFSLKSLSVLILNSRVYRSCLTQLDNLRI